MDDASNLSHDKWQCKHLYHVVFIPKCRRRTYEQLRRHLGEEGKTVAMSSRASEQHVLVAAPRSLEGLNSR